MEGPLPLLTFHLFQMSSNTDQGHVQNEAGNGYLKNPCYTKSKALLTLRKQPQPLSKILLYLSFQFTPFSKLHTGMGVQIDSPTNSCYFS
jgi:hypothetical protein